MASEAAPESLNMLLLWEKLFKLAAIIYVDPRREVFNSNYGNNLLILMLVSAV